VAWQPWLSAVLCCEDEFQFRSSAPCLKCSGTGVLPSFWISGYFYICDELSSGWDPSLNTKIIYVSCTHSPKAILRDICSVPVFRLRPGTGGQVWDFPLVASGLHSKSFTFWSISLFGVLV
jgi:hypothetical protein